MGRMETWARTASAWRPEGGEWMHMRINAQATIVTIKVVWLENGIRGGCFPTPLDGRINQFFKKGMLTRQGYFLIVVSEYGAQECDG